MFDPETFVDLTEIGLEDLQTAEDNRAANLRKSIIKELDMWVEHRATAATCRFVRRLKRELANRARRDIESPPSAALLPE